MSGSILLNCESTGSYASNAMSAIPYTLRVGAYGPYEQKRTLNLTMLIVVWRFSFSQPFCRRDIRKFRNLAVIL